MDKIPQKTDVKTGLTEDEVKYAREQFGENRLSRQRRKSLFTRFLESFGDPMIKILLVALAVNILFLFRQSNWFESIGIAVAILLATFVSTLSEYGSESAFEKLQEEASRISCRVRRNGRVVEIPVDQIVVGDICWLQPGDRVPADGLILEGKLKVDQSALNGESREAAKFPREPVRDRDDLLNPGRLFSGTIVCSGEGLMLVSEIGDETVYGRIGAEIQGETRESPLRLRLAALARSIGKFGYIAAGFTAAAYLFNVIFLDNLFDPVLIRFTLTSPGILFRYIMKAATLAVTVIVMAVPEGLPMMITVVLSANMQRMLKDNVLVRKLTGIETAGSLNILFTDKTGTLTRGRLEVTHFVSGAGKVWTKSQPIPEKLRELVHSAVYYNCSAAMDSQSLRGTAIGGNATDRAALEFAVMLGGGSSSGGGSTARRRVEKTKVVPFSSETKLMATTIKGDWDATLVKGAPEKILPLCSGYYDENGEVRPLRGYLTDAAIKALGEQAIRLIAVAVSDCQADGNRPAGELRDLKLVGLLGIRDGVRREAAEGVRLVRAAGIQTVMITGDSRLTATAIAREAGVLTEEDMRGQGMARRRSERPVITSDEMAAMTDEELSEALPSLRVVARALPSDKSRLVRIAQAKGLVVGMTGDGVNDAPALKQADIGFAMGSGAEIAKEAGDIVILDDNFSSIAKAVCYGRTIFKSIRKFIIYQMSICMCAVGVTVVGPLIGVDFPITVIQMLWINIVMDTLAGLAFSGEIARRKYMEEPPKPRNEPIINRYMAEQIAVNSAYTTLLCLFFLKSEWAYNIFGRHGEIYMLTAFFALFMFTAIFTSFCARTHQINLMDYLAANKPFLWIMGIVTATQVFIIYYGGAVFRTAGLQPRHMLLVVLLAFTIIPVDMLRKFFLNKRMNAGT